MMPVLVLLLGSATPAASGAPDARAEVELAPKGGVWVGQRVTLAITLATPDLFADAPSFDMPPIPGAVVLPPETSPTLGSETVGATTFATQRHEFAVYAHRAGVVRIPAIAVRFGSNAGFGKPHIRRHVTTEAASFLAKTPPGADGLGTVIAARNLKVVDEWRSEPTAPKVGDAFTRTLTVTADDVPGMIFPPFRLDGVEGLAGYPESPAVSDHSERGSLTGRRVERMTYVCEVAGTISVPDRTLTWYDLDANELKTANVPGRTFQVAPMPKPGPNSASAATAPQAWYARWRPAAAAGLVLAGIGLAIAHFWPRCVRSCRRWIESEPARFSRLGIACRSDDPHAAFVALLRWLDRFGPMSLEEFTRRARDPELTGAVTALSDRVYTRPDARVPAGWSGASLISRISLARRALRASSARPDGDSLPPLNPARRPHLESAPMAATFATAR